VEIKNGAVDGVIHKTFTNTRQYIPGQKSGKSLEIALTTLETLNIIVAILIETPDDEMYARVLKVLREVTASDLGFFGFIDESGNLVIPSMTDGVYNECNMENKSVTFPPETWGQSVWGEAIRIHRTMLKNEHCETPLGHLSIENVVCLPLVHSDQTEGLIALANKTGGFDPLTVELLQTITTYLALYFHTWRRVQKEEHKHRLYQAQIIEQLEFLQNLMDTIPNPLFYKNADGVYLGCNTAFAEFAHVTREAVIGKTVYDITAEDFAEMSWEMDCEVISSGKRRVYDAQVKVGSGALRDVTIYKAPFTNLVGDIGGTISVLVDITDRKNAEKALLLKNHVFDASIAAMYTTDINGTITEVNQSLLNLWRYSGKGEVIGMSIRNLLHKDHKAETLLETLGKNGIWEGEYTARRKDNTVFTAYAFCTEFRDRAGNVIGYQSSVIDITERKRAEIERKRSEEKYRSLFENILNGFALHQIVVDDAGEPIDYIFLEVNSAFEAMTSLKREDIIGHKVTEVLPGTENDPANWIRQYGEVALRGKDLRIEQFSVTLDKWYSILAFSPRTGQFATIIDDITEKKKSEISLRESEQRYRSVIDNIGIGIAIVSPDMEILDMNKQMREWFPMIDFGDRPICYKSYNDPPRDTMCSYCPAVKSFADGNIHESVSQTPCEGGVKNYRIVTSPLKDEHGNVTSIIEMVEDITERQHAEEERNNLEKLESIGTLAGGIAHDFNNLLTVIQGNIILCRMPKTPEKDKDGRLEQAEIATERARELTHQLLTFSRGGKPVKEVIQLAPVIKDAADLGLCGSNIKGEYLFEDDLPTVEADAGQVTQVVQNMVVNAVHAMPNGGTVTVEARSKALPEGNSQDLRPGRYVVIKIIDQGKGISAKNLSKIFDPYFTTKEHGNGLGLSTAFSIIKNHYGRIEVNSQPNLGTAFIIYLPASEKQVKVQEVIAGDDEIIKKTGRILVLDDFEFICDLVSKILTQAGYEVDCVANGQEAFDAYKKQAEKGTPYTAVLLDLTIVGGPGGGYAMEKIRAFDPNVVAIASSGYSKDPIMSAYREYGFKGVISKPYKPSDIYRILDEVVSPGNAAE